MKLKEKVSQYRRDTRIILECQSCGYVMPEFTGYDDDNYYVNVIPNIKCTQCGKSSTDLDIINEPVKTRYAPWQVI